MGRWQIRPKVRHFGYSRGKARGKVADKLVGSVRGYRFGNENRTLGYSGIDCVV